MKARCPLCLKTLEQTDQLARMCVTHANLQIISLKGDWRAKVKQCSKGSCQNSNSIEAGIFLRHVGCSETHVHWRPAQNRVIVPLNASLTASRVYRIDHWQFGVLAELARTDPASPEMWFPLALFRTVNWLYLDEDRENGTTVRLAGAQKAGKTVLATMAMTPLGYSGRQHENLVATGENYVYVTPEAGLQVPEQQYLEALLPLSLLRDEQFDPESLVGTPHTRANVKAAFFRVQQKAKGLLREMKDYVTGPRGRRTLVFYDTAGEENERASERFRESVDVGAVLLDVSKLSHFGSDVSPADRRAAQERLTTTPCQQRCLVVTKIDLIKDSLPDKERAVVDQVAAGAEIDENAERDLLRSWLQSPAAQAMDRKLAETLEGHRVFFVWTEGLENAEKGSLPGSFGLRKFVHWCLDGRYGS
ncbi:MAG: hypothetical protein ABJF23_05385 [Bryobacteraceae bacterium]